MTAIRRFEGNTADVNRSKERAQIKRQTRAVLEDDDEETPEEQAFREEQERLNNLAQQIKAEVEREAEDYYLSLRKKPGVWDDEDDA